MDFKDQVKQLGERVAKMKDKILTEEATKNAFITNDHHSVLNKL